MIKFSIVVNRRESLQMSLELAQKYHGAQGHGWTVHRLAQHKVLEGQILPQCLMHTPKCSESLFHFL